MVTLDKNDRLIVDILNNVLCDDNFRSDFVDEHLGSHKRAGPKHAGGIAQHDSCRSGPGFLSDNRADVDYFSLDLADGRAHIDFNLLAGFDKRQVFLINAQIEPDSTEVCHGISGVLAGQFLAERDMLFDHCGVKWSTQGIPGKFLVLDGRIYRDLLTALCCTFGGALGAIGIVTILLLSDGGSISLCEEPDVVDVLGAQAQDV